MFKKFIFLLIISFGFMIKSSVNPDNFGSITLRFTQVGPLYAFQDETNVNQNFPGIWDNCSGEDNGDIVTITYNLTRNLSIFEINNIIEEIINRLNVREYYINWIRN